VSEEEGEGSEGGDVLTEERRVAEVGGC